jgi:tripartite-type tricarboxylate transporter receptor subunit TctC
MTHVPYRGTGPAVVDMVSGRMHVMIDGLNQVRGQVEAGQIRLLAVTGPERAPTSPEVPTTAEAGFPWLVATGWQAIVAPAATPQPVRDRIEAAVRTALADPEFVAAFIAQGTPIRFTPGEALRQMLLADSALWGGIIREADIRLE